MDEGYVYIDPNAFEAQGLHALSDEQLQLPGPPAIQGLMGPATSQNGYEANNRTLINTVAVVGGKVSMRKGDATVVLCYVLESMAKIEKPKWPGIWGYAERTIRGSSTTLSNHASGTAVDWNAPDHWLGEINTFTSTELSNIRIMLRFCDGVIRWGGDYSGRKDEMHFEIVKGTAALAALARKIRALDGSTENNSPNPPQPQPQGTEYNMDEIDLRNANTTEVKGRHVDNLQGLLLATPCANDGLLASSGRCDGIAGPKTRAALGDFQSRVGLDVDYIVGPKTWKALIEY